MKNYVTRGDTVTVTAPYAVSAGGGLLVAGTAKLQSDEIVIEMHDRLDVFDLTAEVAGTKSISGGCNSRWRRIQCGAGCLGRLR